MIDESDNLYQNWSKFSKSLGASLYTSFWFLNKENYYIIIITLAFSFFKFNDVINQFF